MLKQLAPDHGESRARFRRPIVSVFNDLRHLQIESQKDCLVGGNRSIMINKVYLSVYTPLSEDFASVIGCV